MHSHRAGAVAAATSFNAVLRATRNKLWDAPVAASQDDHEALDSSMGDIKAAVKQLQKAKPPAAVYWPAITEAVMGKEGAPGPLADLEPLLRLGNYAHTIQLETTMNERYFSIRGAIITKTRN